MELVIRPLDEVLRRFHNRLGALGDEKAQLVLARALNREGKKIKTKVIRSLTKQTGLKRQVIVRAVRQKQALGSTLVYQLETKGGDIRLKYFRPRETKAGVIAYPWGSKHTYASKWMRAGQWPNRVGLKWGGEVKERVGASRLPTHTVHSGVFIPKEMVQGATAAAFQASTPNVAKAVEHELAYLLGNL